MDEPDRLIDQLIESHETLARSHELLVQSHQVLADAVAAKLRAVSNGVGKRPSQPSIHEWRTYEGFRDDMRHREREWNRHNRRADGTHPSVTKKALAGQSGGDSDRTISRTMDRYHLDPLRDWPPSSWPDHPPEMQPSLPHLVTTAAIFAGAVLLDVMTDGRLDGVVRICKLLLGRLSGQV